MADGVVLVILDLYDTLSDEVHLFHVGLVVQHSFARGHDSAEHRDNELVDESSLAVVEEMVERLFKFHKDSSILDDLRLHHWGDLLVELKFFDNQVEIV